MTSRLKSNLDLPGSALDFMPFPTPTLGVGGSGYGANAFFNSTETAGFAFYANATSVSDTFYVSGAGSVSYDDWAGSAGIWSTTPKITCRADGSWGWTTQNYLPAASEDFTGWTLTGATVNATPGSGPLLAYNNNLITSTGVTCSFGKSTSTGFAADWPVSTEILVGGQSALSRYVYFTGVSARVTNTATIVFDLQTGSVVGTPPSGWSAAVSNYIYKGLQKIPLPAGCYRIIVRFIATGNSSYTWGISRTTATNGSVSGDSCYFAQAHRHRGWTDVQYIKTTTATVTGPSWHVNPVNGLAGLIIESVRRNPEGPTTFPWSEDLTQWSGTNTTTAFSQSSPAALSPFGEPCSTLQATSADQLPNSLVGSVLRGPTANSFTTWNFAPFINPATLSASSGAVYAYIGTSATPTWVDVTSQLTAGKWTRLAHPQLSITVTSGPVYYGIKIGNTTDILSVSCAVPTSNTTQSTPIPAYGAAVSVTSDSATLPFPVTVSGATLPFLGANGLSAGPATLYIHSSLPWVDPAAGAIYRVVGGVYAASDYSNHQLLNGVLTPAAKLGGVAGSGATTNGTILSSNLSSNGGIEEVELSWVYGSGQGTTVGSRSVGMEASSINGDPPMPNPYVPTATASNWVGSPTAVRIGNNPGSLSAPQMVYSALYTQRAVPLSQLRTWKWSGANPPSPRLFAAITAATQNTAGVDDMQRTPRVVVISDNAFQTVLLVTWNQNNYQVEPANGQIEWPVRVVGQRWVYTKATATYSAYNGEAPFVILQQENWATGGLGTVGFGLPICVKSGTNAGNVIFLWGNDDQYYTFNVTGASWSGGQLTLSGSGISTTNVVAGVNLHLSGSTNPNYNTAFRVVSASSTTVVVTCASDPGAIGGTVTARVNGGPVATYYMSVYQMTCAAPLATPMVWSGGYDANGLPTNPVAQLGSGSWGAAYPVAAQNFIGAMAWDQLPSTDLDYPNRIAVATRMYPLANGLLYSDDGGATWTEGPTFTQANWSAATGLNIDAEIDLTFIPNLGHAVWFMTIRIGASTGNYSQLNIGFLTALGSCASISMGGQGQSGNGSSAPALGVVAAVGGAGNLVSSNCDHWLVQLDPTGAIDPVFGDIRISGPMSDSPSRSNFQVMKLVGSGNSTTTWALTAGSADNIASAKTNGGYGCIVGVSGKLVLGAFERCPIATSFDPPTGSESVTLFALRAS